MSGGDFTDKLRSLIGEFERSPLKVVHIRRGEVEIHLSRDVSGSIVPQERTLERADRTSQRGAGAASSGAISDGGSGKPAQGPGVPPGSVVVAAPNIGTFYRSPKPGAAPYVEIGQRVSAGEELCLIEVMKLFTALRSEVSGTVKAILVEDGAMVEAGQPLFAIGDD